MVVELPGVGIGLGIGEAGGGEGGVDFVVLGGIGALVWERASFMDWLAKVPWLFQ